MLLQPRKTRYKKAQKGRIKPYLMYNKYSRNSAPLMKIKKIRFNLVSCESGRLSSVQIEAARIALNRKIRKFARVNIQVYPNVPITEKPNEVRMGQGKGSVVRWISRIKPNRVLFKVPANFNTVNKPYILQGLYAAANKLPFLTTIVISNLS